MTDLLYLLAAVGFILGLRLMTSPRTARAGNALSAVGMLLAVVVTLVDQDVVGWGGIGLGVAIGAGIGAIAARRVPITSLPEMVAAFNGSGGAASALVAASLLVELDGGELPARTSISSALSLGIGALTASGSAIAYGKLRGTIAGRPIVSAAVRATTIVAGVTVVAGGVWAVATDQQAAYWAVAAAGLVLGVVAVLPIGGADMPVVISLLNSFSGLAAAAAGFVIENSALIIAGALVGSAGLILTMLMCRAMNRSLLAVVLGGFGGTGSAGGADTVGDAHIHRATPEDVAITLRYASSVLVVPGYGLAVAQAQHALRRLATELEEAGVEVHYAIHPVAGRMPGHMNVLLAEAEIPYEQLLELEEANARLPRTDAVLVVGANDVVNTAARDDPHSPIHGMPILEVDRAGTVIIVKRSLSPGFAGIDNPVFYNDNTLMFLHDAREALEEATGALAGV